MTSPNQQQSSLQSDTGARRTSDDEIDVIKLLLFLWSRRKWIIRGTAAIIFIGLIYALLASPVYRSEAIIAPKESPKGGGTGAILSQFGGLGSMMATQLGLGNATLDRMEVIAKSRGLAETVIKDNNLLPVLFPKSWDKKKNYWKPMDKEDIPTIKEGIMYMRESILSVAINRQNNTIKLGVNIYDSNLTVLILNQYLSMLNKRLQEDNVREANANRSYLEKQFNNTSDPILREKIQNMIASEIERSMLVNSQSFDVLEKPVVPISREKPKRTHVLILSVLLGFFVSIFSVFLWRFFKNVQEKYRKNTISS